MNEAYDKYKENSELKDAEVYLYERLGGNMNISFLTPLLWHETMVDYAKRYHKKIVEESNQ